MCASAPGLNLLTSMPKRSDLPTVTLEPRYKTILFRNHHFRKIATNVKTILKDTIYVENRVKEASVRSLAYCAFVG